MNRNEILEKIQGLRYDIRYWEGRFDQASAVEPDAETFKRVVINKALATDLRHHKDLSKQEVAEIRSLASQHGAHQGRIAEKYKVASWVVSMIKTGRLFNQPGINNSKKLTTKQAGEIKYLKAAGLFSTEDIASHYNVHPSTVYYIKSGKVHKKAKPVKPDWVEA